MTPAQLQRKQLNVIAALREEMRYAMARLDDLEAAVRERRAPTRAASIALQLETERSLGALARDNHSEEQPAP